MSDYNNASCTRMSLSFKVICNDLGVLIAAAQDCGLHAFWITTSKYTERKKY